MGELKRELKILDKGNLEDILSAITDEYRKQEYERKIFELINSKDNEFINHLKSNAKLLISLKTLLNYFYTPHPQVVNIVSTNYDCILEHALSYYGIPFSDGFAGREFSTFNTSNFKKEKNINLYKVHGSLRWESISSNQVIRFSCHNNTMAAVFPNRDKYERTHNEPFRTLIQKSDDAISNAKCFLVIGFGFNDEHLTPKIEGAINDNRCIVVVTKTATTSCKEKLKNASNYMLIEKLNSNKTKFSLKQKSNKTEEFLDGEYWKLEQFNQILGI